MLRLLDGPCKAELRVSRVPYFLRAVLKANGNIDALDQMEDTPAADEKVFVYRLQGTPGSYFLDARGKGGKSISGRYVMANYKYLPDVDGEQLRDNTRWREWCRNVGLVKFVEDGTP